MPYGKIVDCWQRDNVMPPMPEEEYPIYQSASFRRFKRTLKLPTCCSGRLEGTKSLPSHVSDDFTSIGNNETVSDDLYLGQQRLMLLHQSLADPSVSLCQATIHISLYQDPPPSPSPPPFSSP